MRQFQIVLTYTGQDGKRHVTRSIPMIESRAMNQAGEYNALGYSAEVEETPESAEKTKLRKQKRTGSHR